MTHRTLRQRLTDYLDSRTAEADAQATAYGLTATATSRHGRTYRDPRYSDLRMARAEGCFCVPLCPPTGCNAAAAVETRQEAMR